MANQPTVGVFLPSYLNTCNSTSVTGAGDNNGLRYPTGLNAGKLIELGPGEAQNLAAPGTNLYDGAYMWVKLDSSATASLATEGLAAYIRLDSGPTQGALPETSYNVPTVTTEDIVTQIGSSVNLFAGVFINPATVSGQANTPTPGNWLFIFVGAGRCKVNYKAGITSGVLGNAVNCGAGSGQFDAATTSGITSVARAVTLPVSSTSGLAYFKDIFYRLPN